MSERVLFVADWLRQEASMMELCRRYGVSRKTGYQWVQRAQAEGEQGLRDRSRAPIHCPHRLDERRVEAILELRAVHPTWGPRKLRHRLWVLHPDQPWPAASTIGELLRRHGLVVARRRRRRASPTAGPLTHPEVAGQVWSADFKGDFVLGDGRRCWPLTIADGFSRYLIRCVGLSGHTGYRAVQPIFEAAFRQWGLPSIIRTDNGPPFASTGLCGLSHLAVWWIKLGIEPERIEPGHPEQNGVHERMHRTLKAEATRPPAANLRGQQQQFERFAKIYNEQRPHEALAMATPAERFAPAPRSYPCALIASPEYPHGWLVRSVRPGGAFKFNGRPIHLCDALSGEHVGLKAAEDDGWWDIYYGTELLAHFDQTCMRIVPRERGA